MSEKKELSQESKLYALCEGLKFIQCERETYAKISVGNHVEIHNIQGESFQNWVLERFQTEHGMACRQTSLATLKLNLHALASREGAKEFVHKRIVRFGNRVYIDLCNPDWGLSISARRKTGRCFGLGCLALSTRLARARCFPSGVVRVRRKAR